MKKLLTILTIFTLLSPSIGYAKKCADFKTQQTAQKWFDKQRNADVYILRVLLMVNS